jgi:hypothetical protein
MKVPRDQEGQAPAQRSSASSRTNIALTPDQRSPNNNIASWKGPGGGSAFDYLRGSSGTPAARWSA